MRLSSSSRGFSNSSVVMFCALSVAGPNRARMDASQADPPAASEDSFSEAARATFLRETTGLLHRWGPAAVQGRARGWCSMFASFGEGR